MARFSERYFVYHRKNPHYCFTQTTIDILHWWTLWEQGICMNSPCQGVEIGFDISTTKSFSLREIWMAEWPKCLLINKSNHWNIDSMLIFRFRPYYVNSLFLQFYCTMLHNHNLRGVPGDDVITAFRRQSILGYLFRNFHQEAYQNSERKIF